MTDIASTVNDRSYNAANKLNLEYRLVDKGQTELGKGIESSLTQSQNEIVIESNKILQDALKIQYKNMFVAVSFTFLISVLLTVGLLKTLESIKFEKAERLMLKDEAEKMDFREVISSFQVKLAELDAEIMDAKLASKK